MPKLPKWIKHRKTEYERSLEPGGLAGGSMIKEVRAAVFILSVFFGGIIFVAAAAKFYMWEGDTVITYMVLAVVVDLVALAGYAAYDYFLAVKTPLFRTEFGYRGSLRAVYDLFIERHNIRKLITTEDKVQDIATLHERVDKFILDEKAKKELKDLFKKDMKLPFNLTYFYHPKQPIEGWNRDTQTRPIHTSFFLLHPKPTEEQFVFGQINDVWHGNLFISHPHGESMNLKVVTWSIDPFTSQPVPWCILKHSSINYDNNLEESTDIKTLEAMSVMVINQHAILRGYQRDNSEKEVLLTSKFHQDIDTVDYGHKIAETDMNLFKGIMKAVTSGFWNRLGGLGKALVTIALIAAGVFIVWLVLSWLGYARLPW